MKEEQIVVGGQAVIEGVMMRAPRSYAVAVRRRDGEIVSMGEPLPALAEKYPLLRVPIVRGSAVLLHSMYLGIKALNFSANVAFHEEENDSSQKKAKGNSSAGAIGSIALAIIINILMFIVLPLVLTNMIFVYFGGGTIGAASDGAWYQNAWAWLQAAMKPVRPSVAFNLVDGLIRMTFFLIMIVTFSLLRDIRRVFEYHGAEHKVVHTWEAGEELTVENARRKPRQHPRCGTSFLMIVMMVSIIAFSVIKFDSLFLNFLVRLLLIPVIAGVSYEVIRASARSRAQWFFSIITRPGIWLQNLTTKEPDDSQLEVALVALKESLRLEPAVEETAKAA
ncbi:MAG TPA: DUF1385 domain-containing protein [Blastocatellia bacterium]|jgi:uncharacterized protein YqhQ